MSTLADDVYARLLKRAAYLPRNYILDHPKYDTGIAEFGLLASGTGYSVQGGPFVHL